MRTKALAAPLKLSAHLFRTGGKLNWTLAGSIMGLACLQGGVLALVCWWDGSWHLELGKGFSQHYGSWAILVTDPLLLLASGFLDRQFLVTITSLPLCEGSEPRQRMRELLRRFVPVVRGKGPTAYLYIFMVFVGLLAWLDNVVRTYDPSGPYHHVVFDDHDVFDSGTHVWSFVTFKACLFLSWVIIYPIVCFKFITVSVSTRLLLRRIEIEALVCPRVEHPDGCYGLKNVGTLNIAILAPYILVFIAIFSLMATHNMYYQTLVLPLLAASTVFLVTSFVVIHPVYSALCRARVEEYRQLLKAPIDGASASDADLYRFTARRFFYSEASASPYSDGTKVMIALMRLSPAAGFALSLFRPSGG
jgi:hypothetical protein